MGECCGEFIFVVIAMVVLVWIYGSKEEKQKQSDLAENRSGSTDYIYKRDENPRKIGGTNLDRFFVECALSGCNDFTVEKNVEKAKLLADKYNLSYGTGIKGLYEQALTEHKKISQIAFDEKLDALRKREKEEYDELTRYAELNGKNKKATMLSDQARKLREKADSLDKTADFIMRSTQQREQDWAVLGGIASGIAGAGAGVATALNAQANNEKIRAQNEANLRAAIPSFMNITGSAAQNRANAKQIDEQIELLKEKLVSQLPSSQVMALLEVYNATVSVSETGAYKVTASVKPKEPLFIYDDVRATADGTILAHVFNGEEKIGTVKMVLPVNGVSNAIGIVGMGLSGAKRGVSYTVTFSDYHLWLMEI